jgi:hypothetical protein
MSVESKINKLIEENIFRGEKIKNPELAKAIKNDYENGTLSDLGSSAIGGVVPFANPVSGVYQGRRTGHPIAGFFGGKPAALGAASNNVEGISLSDAFTTTNVAGNLGIFAPHTAIQYGIGKLFGGRAEAPEYAERLAKHNISPGAINEKLYNQYNKKG